MTALPATLDIDDAATALDISTTHLRKLVQRGIITPIRAGARPLRFHTGDVYRLQVARRTPEQVRWHDTLWAQVDSLLADQH